MRICHVSGEFYDILAGGIGTQVYRLAQKQVSLGHQVDIISYDLGHPKYTEQEEGFKVHKVPLSHIPVFKHFKWGWDAAALVKKMHVKKRYDVVHVHMNAAMGYSLFHRVDVPMVSTIHSIYARRAKHKQGIKKILARLNFKQVIICAKKSEKVIVVNTPIVEEVSNFGVKKDKIVYIPNCIDVTDFTARCSIETRHRYHIEDRDIMVLYVGRLAPQKGLEYLLKSADKLDASFKVIIVGDGDRDYKRYLFQQSNKNQDVIFTGPLFGDDLREIYASSDIFVLPSLFEGLPTVLLEAMASGLPIIASDIPSIAPLVKPGFGVLVKPKDAIGLSQAITRLGTSEELHKMGEKAKEEVRKYDWNRTIKDIINVYEEVVKA